MSESEAWRTITQIASGVDRIDAHLSQLEAKVTELAATVARLTDDRAASSEREEGMEELEGTSRDPDLASSVRGVLEELGVTDALAVAEVVALYRDHPRWAVWPPVPGRQWTAVRPASSRPPEPEVPMIWVHADTAVELGARMGRADAGLAPG
jgi:hypothetical protein